METLIAVLIAAIMALTGCSSTTQKQGTVEDTNKNLVDCGYCDNNEENDTIHQYQTYKDIKEGYYHEDCYYNLLQEKYAEDHKNNGYDMIICTNCNEFGESVNQWVAYKYCKPNCPSCGNKLEFKNFSTYEDFLLREEKQEEQQEQQAELTVEEPNYDTCKVCGVSNSSVAYHEGIHGYFAGSYYCNDCYNRLYQKYEIDRANMEAEKHICIFCAGNDSYRPIEWFDGDGIFSSGYYHGLCYSSLMENYNNNSDIFYHGTVYCPNCGYETGEYGQEYLYNHDGNTSCPQCGSTMREH